MSKEMAIILALAVPAEVLMQKIEEGFDKVKGELLIGKEFGEIDSEILNKLGADMTLLGMKIHTRDNMENAMEMIQELSVIEKGHNLLTGGGPTAQN